MKLLTLSKAGLLERCAAFLNDSAVWSSTSSSAATYGQAGHLYPQRSIERGRPITEGSYLALPAVAKLSPEEQETLLECARMWAEQWWEKQSDKSWLTEETYAFDPVSGDARRLGAALERDYRGVRHGEIVGTADAIGIYYDANRRAHVHVADWKFGRQEHLAEAKEHAQIRALGCVIARAYGVCEVEVSVVHITPDELTETSALFDEYDLAEIEAGLKANMLRLSKGEVAPTPGPWCAELYCPAIGSCPAVHEAAEGLLPSWTSSPMAIEKEAIRSPEHAASIYARLTAIESMAEACWTALKEYVSEIGPIQLADGRVYSQHISERETILPGHRTNEVLRKHLGDDWLVALKTTVTKAGLMDAARVAAGKSGAASIIERSALQELRAAGLVSSVPTAIFRASKAKK